MPLKAFELFKLYKALVTSILLYGCETWTLLADPEKGSRLSKPKARRHFSVFPTLSTRPTTACGARSASLWVHRDLFWNCQETETRKQVQALQAPDMSHATTASPEPSFMEPWRLGDAAVSRGNAGWTTSKTGHPCPFQKRSQGPAAEKKKTGRSLLNRPSCPPDDPIGQETGLNCIVKGL